MSWHILIIPTVLQSDNTIRRMEHRSGNILDGNDCTGAVAVRWISPAWLDDHRDTSLPVIVDCRQNSHAYFTNHIPGAVWLSDALLRVHTGLVPVRWLGPEPAQILLSHIGISRDEPVVVYSSGGPKSPTGLCTGDGLEQYFVAYSLARYGCRQVLVLDGGLERWRAEGRPLSHAFGSTTPSGFTADVQESFLIGYNTVVQRKDSPGVILLDTRPLAWYEGQGPWSRPGHIPGAVNLPAAMLLNPDNLTLLKPVGEIQEILARAGIVPEKTIICSCGTGRIATLVFLILKFLLGYPDVLMFEGGFTEWISHPDNPVVTGKNPR